MERSWGAQGGVGLHGQGDVGLHGDFGFGVALVRAQDAQLEREGERERNRERERDRKREGGGSKDAGGGGCLGMEEVQNWRPDERGTPWSWLVPLTEMAGFGGAGEWYGVQWPVGEVRELLYGAYVWTLYGICSCGMACSGRGGEVRDCT